MSESNPWPANHPVPVAGAILDGGNELLLVRPKHLDQFWLVSGYLEAWESAEDAAIREVREEVGMTWLVTLVIGSGGWMTAIGVAELAVFGGWLGYLLFGSRGPRR